MEIPEILSDDLDGELRPQFGSWDIGGDELVPPPFFADGFETGDTSMWSEATP